jgi:adenylate cyclase
MPCQEECRRSTCVASAAFAYGILGRRFDEALELAGRAIQLHPNSTFGRNRAGAVYSVSGESDKARVEIDRILAQHPIATLARARRASFRYDWMYDLYLDGLRKAGLPGP